MCIVCVWDVCVLVVCDFQVVWNVCVDCQCVQLKPFPSVHAQVLVFAGVRTRGAFNPELGLRRGCVIIFWRSVTLGSIYEVVRQLSSFSLPTHFKRFPNIHTLKHTYKILGQSPPSISQVQGQHQFSVRIPNSDIFPV